MDLIQRIKNFFFELSIKRKLKKRLKEIRKNDPYIYK
jgi:hypothetical protein